MLSSVDQSSIPKNVINWFINSLSSSHANQKAVVTREHIFSAKIADEVQCKLRVRPPTIASAEVLLSTTLLREKFFGTRGEVSVREFVTR